MRYRANILARSHFWYHPRASATGVRTRARTPPFVSPPPKRRADASRRTFDGVRAFDAASFGIPQKFCHPCPNSIPSRRGPLFVPPPSKWSRRRLVLDYDRSACPRRVTAVTVIGTWNNPLKESSAGARRNFLARDDRPKGFDSRFPDPSVVAAPLSHRRPHCGPGKMGGRRTTTPHPSLRGASSTRPSGPPRFATLAHGRAARAPSRPTSSVGVTASQSEGGGRPRPFVASPDN